MDSTMLMVRVIHALGVVLYPLLFTLCGLNCSQSLLQFGIFSTASIKKDWWLRHWPLKQVLLYHDLYLCLTIANMFTPFKSTQEWKDFTEKAWVAGLSEPSEWLINWISVLGQSRWPFDLWWGHLLAHQSNLYSFGYNSPKPTFWYQIWGVLLQISNIQKDLLSHTPKMSHSPRISAHFKKHTRRSISPEYFCC